MLEMSEQSARLDILSAVCVCYREHCAPAAALHKKELHPIMALYVEETLRLKKRLKTYLANGFGRYGF
jgi:hypothetical protein